MFGRDNGGLNSKFVPVLTTGRIEASNFKGVKSLPSVPLDTLSLYLHGKVKGVTRIGNPEQIMSLIEQGGFGDVVGLWVKDDGRVSKMAVFNREGKILDNWWEDITKELKEDAVFGYRYDVGRYVMLAGPDIDLVDLIKSL